MNKLKGILGLLMVAIVIVGCSKEEPDPGAPKSPDPYVNIIFEFTQNVDGSTLATDTIQYENAIGNIYGVKNLQFLVAKIRLDSWEETEKTYINEYHLYDLNDPTTWSFRVKDTIKYGSYNNITLFMGFDEKNNITGKYPDLNDLGWGWNPNYGGGYYTLKMDGGYLSDASSTTPFGYEIAIGGKRLVENQVDTFYTPNPRYASMVNSSNTGFDIPLGTKTVKVEIRMNINKLFKNNFEIGNFDLDLHPSNLEQDAIGSKTLSENLTYAFSIGDVTFDEAAEQ